MVGWKYKLIVSIPLLLLHQSLLTNKLPLTSFFHSNDVTVPNALIGQWTVKLHFDMPLLEEFDGATAVELTAIFAVYLTTVVMLLGPAHIETCSLADVTGLHWLWPWFSCSFQQFVLVQIWICWRYVRISSAVSQILYFLSTGRKCVHTEWVVYYVHSTQTQTVSTVLVS